MGDLLIRNCSVWEWDLSCICQGRVRDSVWIHIAGGQILKIKNEIDTVPQDLLSSCREIQASGKLVIPGLIDAHIHTATVGESHYFVDLSGCTSINSLKDCVKTHMDKNPELSWIVGVGWDQTLLSRYPCRSDLDEVCSTKPVSS